MTTTSILRRAAVAAGLALAAAGLALAQAPSASAVEYVAQTQAGSIQAPDGMVIGSDVYAGYEIVPRIRAGALLVGASPASTAAQRVEARASLQRYDESAQGWRATGQSGVAFGWIPAPWRRTLVGGESQASNWTFTTTQDDPALYRVSYTITWFVHDGDTDPGNDVVLGNAVIRPSEDIESVCNTTPFTNWPDVACTVTAEGVVI